ncbi:MAG: hypothetical protein ACMUJM_25200, partial [bacterium]
RLFVPLRNEPFYWFKEKEKSFELRVYGRAWTEKNVYKGRNVELSRGYSTGDIIKGKIGRVIIGPLEHIFEKIDFEKIIPVAGTEEKALTIVDSIFKGRKEKYIAFEVLW